MATISYSQLLRQNRDFRLLWCGQVVSQLGDWFSLITLQSLLLQLTGSALSLSRLLVAQMLPLFLLSPLAGVVVDRFPRSRVMVGADLTRMLFALGFLLVRDRHTAPLAYVFMAALSSATVFFEPARQAVLPQVTRSEELLTANALSAVTWSVLLTSGALAGGVVTQYLGRDVAFVLNAVSFLGSSLLVGRINEPATIAVTSHGLTELLGGFRYVMRHHDLLALLTVKAAWGLTYGSQVLVTLFGQRIFPLGPNRGPITISLLTAIGGVGTALGPVIARRLTGSGLRRMYAILPLGFLTGGGFCIALAHSWSLATVAGALFGLRLGGSALWVFSTVLLQKRTANQFLGRVFAAEGALFTLTMALSGYEMGAAVDRGISVFACALILGAISLVFGALWTLGWFRLAGQREEGEQSPALVGKR